MVASAAIGCEVLFPMMYCHLHYNRPMPVREALIIEAGGERFRFYYDMEAPDVLHITHRHGTTPAEAIRTFFADDLRPWNDRRQRYESASATHGLYWTRHPHDGSVIVITCFEWEEQS